MKLAIQKAKQFGIGCVLVKNAGHLGGAGYHASMAAKQGCIGQVLVYLHPITHSAFNDRSILYGIFLKFGFSLYSALVLLVVA